MTFGHLELQIGKISTEDVHRFNLSLPLGNMGFIEWTLIGLINFTFYDETSHESGLRFRISHGRVQVIGSVKSGYTDNMTVFFNTGIIIDITTNDKRLLGSFQYSLPRLVHSKHLVKHTIKQNLPITIEEKVKLEYRSSEHNMILKNNQLYIEMNSSDSFKESNEFYDSIDVPGTNYCILLFFFIQDIEYGIVKITHSWYKGCNVRISQKNIKCIETDIKSNWSDFKSIGHRRIDQPIFLKSGGILDHRVYIEI